MPISQAYHRHITDTQISQILCIPSTLVLTFNPRVNRIRYVSDVWLWRVPLHLTLSQMVHFYGYASIYKCQQILVVKEAPHNKQSTSDRKITKNGGKKKKVAMKLILFLFAILFTICATAEEKVETSNLRMVSFEAYCQRRTHMLGRWQFLQKKINQNKDFLTF